MLSCSYSENPAPALTPAGFAIRNPAKSVSDQIWKKQIRYSPIDKAGYVRLSVCHTHEPLLHGSRY